MKEVTIYTDGACLKNPGNGGWCGILIYNEKQKIISGSESNTTNNRMELRAVIESLSTLKEKCKVKLYSDSKYVVDAINKKWLENWEKNNFKKRLNTDLWKKFLPLLEKHTVKFIWTKGHSGNKLNDMCDKIAVQEAKKIL